ncbi:MAG: DUF2231 domain-containing protein [Gammaproteobacteria bacterium]
MSNLLYNFLTHIGYSHPLHPVLVHIPAGLSTGALCFALWSIATGQTTYRTTAYRMVVLALIFALLAFPVGLMDWQRFYGGARIFEIEMKLVLASVYILLLITAVIMGRQHIDSALLPVLYFFGTLCVAGLGFFGGQLVYSGFSPEAPEQFKTGKRIFESNCSGCHRRGENIIVPNLPLRNAPQLNDFKKFLSFIRAPRMPNGSPGIMPNFPLSKLSDEKTKQLYDYLYFEFRTPNRPDT